MKIDIELLYVLATDYCRFYVCPTVVSDKMNVSKPLIRYSHIGWVSNNVTRGMYWRLLSARYFAPYIIT